MELVNYLLSITDIDVEILNRLIENFRHTKLKNTDHFLMENNNSNKIGYLKKGICRGYYIDKDGNDFTTNFMIAPTFIGDLAAIASNHNCKINIQALENCEIEIGSIKTLYALAEVHPTLNKLFRIIIEKAYTLQQNRQVSFITQNATERYLELIQNRKEVFDRVSQIYIASYLGITPQSLSRIRKRLPQKIYYHR